MSEKQFHKTMLLIFIPFIFDYVMGSALLDMYISGMMLWNISMYIFWFWVGSRFAKLPIGRNKSYFLGQLLWLLLFLLYIVEFVILDDSRRHNFIALISQCYPTAFVTMSTNISSLLTNQLNITGIMILAYFLMLIVFTLGFTYGRFQKK